MSYLAIAKMVNDTDLQMRITACAAQESVAVPERWAENHRWQLAVTPGWPQAYASALAASNPKPGADEGVITDGMIIASVQPKILAEQASQTEA